MSFTVRKLYANKPDFSRKRSHVSLGLIAWRWVPWALGMEKPGSDGDYSGAEGHPGSQAGATAARNMSEVLALGPPEAQVPPQL